MLLDDRAIGVDVSLKLCDGCILKANLDSESVVETIPFPTSLVTFAETKETRCSFLQTSQLFFLSLSHWLLHPSNANRQNDNKSDYFSVNDFFCVSRNF